MDEEQCKSTTCESCNIHFKRNCDFKRHLTSSKHQKRLEQQPPSVYTCQPCGFSTTIHCFWNRHTNTKKHIVKTNDNIRTYACENCNREDTNYKTHWAHRQKCDIKKDAVKDTPDNVYLTAINQLIEDNKKEMRSFLVDEFRKITETSITNNINHGTINNKFNINFFLNDQCKDAENMSDFIKRIVVSRDDLENNAHLGFVNGITKIFIDNLKQLDIHKRPIHCTDIKRETIYIKDDDKWTREEDDRKIRKAVQEISRKSVGTLIEWKQTNPDYIDGDSEFSQLCIPMLRHSIAGDDRETFLPKVVKNVLREVVISR